MSRPPNHVLAAEKALLSDGLLQCRKCKEVKPVAEFGKHTRTRTGFMTACRDCANYQNRQYVVADPDHTDKLAAKARAKRAYIKENDPEAYAALRERERAKNNSPGMKRYRRSWQLQRDFNITLDQYEALLVGQNGHCAICGTDQPGQKAWHVDHDHATGLVRGLLCRRCNNGLGYFTDNADTLRSAISYLADPPAAHLGVLASADSHNVCRPGDSPLPVGAT